MSWTDFSLLPLKLFPLVSGLFSTEIFSAVLGALLAFFFSWWLQRRSDRKNRALELIQEYSSPDFIEIRNEAGRAIRTVIEAHAQPSWGLLFQTYGTASTGEWLKISKIKHFYEKLNYLVSIGEVNTQYVNGYFFEEFTHWNHKYFTRINAATEVSKRELDLSALEKSLSNPRNSSWRTRLGISRTS
ncbi:hypothetical protein MCEMSHM24_03870 [Comamonadaceae bacterium]